MQDWHLDKTERFLEAELLERKEKRSVLEVWVVRLPDGQRARLVLFSPRATKQLAPFPGDRSAVPRPHPRILGLLRVGLEPRPGGDAAYLLLECRDAVRLSDMMEKGLLWERSQAQDRVLALARDCAGVLAELEADEANRAGWVPGHLNPDAIWMSDAGQVFLEHPLLSQAVSELQSLSLRAASKYLGYMSPEQVGGRPLDMRSDLFSFAVVLYELLSGKKLFDGESRSQIVAKVKEAVVPPLAQVCPWVEERVSRLVLKALSRDQEDRPKSWAAWLEELSLVSGQRAPVRPAEAADTEAWTGDPPGKKMLAQPKSVFSGAVGSLANHAAPLAPPDGRLGPDADPGGRPAPAGPGVVSEGDLSLAERTVAASAHPDMITHTTGIEKAVEAGPAMGGPQAWWRQWAWELGLSFLLVLSAGGFVARRMNSSPRLKGTGSGPMRTRAGAKSSSWRILSRQDVSRGEEMVLVGGGRQDAKPRLKAAGRCFEARYWVRSAGGQWQAVFFIPAGIKDVQLSGCHP